MTTVSPGMVTVELRGALAGDPGLISLRRPGGGAEPLTRLGAPETASGTLNQNSAGGQGIMSFGVRGTSGTGGMRLGGLSDGGDRDGAGGLLGSQLPMTSNGDGAEQPDAEPGGLFGSRLVASNDGGMGGGDGGMGGGDGGMGGGDGGMGGGDGGMGGGDGGMGGGDGGMGGGDGGMGG
ncbi:MAG: hypothetical protein AAF371_05845, partial [Pseudomonadota bacterium]